MPTNLLRFVHVALACTFSAGVIGSHLSVLAARRAPTWQAKAALYGITRTCAVVFGLGSLLLLGVLGNVLALSLGYRMADTPVFRLANGLWLFAVLGSLLLEAPAAAGLVAQTRGLPSDAPEPAGHAATLARWRLGNGIVLVAWAVSLWFMTQPWR